MELCGFVGYNVSSPLKRTNMNSSPEELPVNGDLNEQSPSGSQLPQSDSNANLNSGQSKGAIPKNRSYAKSSTPKKCTKINNNVEEVRTVAMALFTLVNTIRREANLTLFTSHSCQEQVFFKRLKMHIVSLQ